jgi:hypothetical protein
MKRLSFCLEEGKQGGTAWFCRVESNSSYQFLRKLLVKVLSARPRPCIFTVDARFLAWQFFDSGSNTTFALNLANFQDFREFKITRTVSSESLI